MQNSRNVNLVKKARIGDKCAGCGEKNPEYVLEESCLCFDCYIAEKFYWAKR